MDKVYCPWCGREMKLGESLPFSGVFAFYCKCGAVSPNEGGAEEALKAALKRPFQKPLTLEELQSATAGTVVWMEQNVLIPVIEAVVSDGKGKYGNFYIGVEPCKTEPKFARYWAKKPTKEEREAAKWDE